MPVEGCKPDYAVCFSREQAAALTRYIADLQRWQRDVELACTTAEEDSP